MSAAFQLSQCFTRGEMCQNMKQGAREMNHFQDEHCSPGADGICPCGMSFSGEPNCDCGGDAFHRPGCLDSDATGVPIFLNGQPCGVDAGGAL